MTNLHQTSNSVGKSSNVRNKKKVLTFSTFIQQNTRSLKPEQLGKKTKRKTSKSERKT